MERQIRFKNHAGEHLSGTLHVPAEPAGRGAVLAHCFTCSRHTTILRHLGTALADAGYTALRFDFSGNGQSEGKFEDSTFSKQIAEIQCAVDVIAREGVSWVALAGHSLGAEVSVLAASGMPAVRGVCAIAGRLSGLKPDHFLTQKQIETLHRSGSVSFVSRGRNLRIKSEFVLKASRYDLPAVIRSFDRPLMIVHGEADEIVPVEEAKRAESMNPRYIELFVLSGADHMFSRDQDRQAAARAVVDWLHEQP